MSHERKMQKGAPRPVAQARSCNEVGAKFLHIYASTSSLYVCCPPSTSGLSWPLICSYLISDSRTSQMTSTFPLFRELPPELRLMVWQNALPGARTIHLVKVVAEDANPCSRKKSQCTSTIPCPKTVISMLHTCAESRAVVVRRYKALFSPRSLTDRFFSLHFFDPATDGIFVDDIWPWVRGEIGRAHV